MSDDHVQFQSSISQSGHDADQQAELILNHQSSEVEMANMESGGNESQAADVEEATSSHPTDSDDATSDSGSEASYHTAEEEDPVDVPDADRVSQHSTESYDSWTWYDQYRSPERGKNRWYVVLVGRETGVFKNCHALVTGYPGAVFRKVRGKEKAEELYRIGMASLRAAAEREKAREEFLGVS